MVLLTVVTNSNPHTLYFDHPIEKPSYIRLLSASLYNSWHNLKEEAVIYANIPNDTLEARLLPGHYTVDSLVNEFNALSANNEKFTLTAKAHTPVGSMIINGVIQGLVMVCYNCLVFKAYYLSHSSNG